MKLHSPTTHFCYTGAPRFYDSADPELRRHLLRLWLMDETLPAVPAVRMHKSLAGIEKLTGRQNYYRGPGYAGS